MNPTPCEAAEAGLTILGIIAGTIGGGFMLTLYVSIAGFIFACLGG